METLDASEMVITLSVYLVTIIIVLLCTWLGKWSHPFWSIFNSSAMRLVAVILLLVTAGSITLYYNDWLAYFFVPLIFLVAILYPFIQHGSKKVSGWITMLITFLVIIMAVPVVLSLIKKENMSKELSVGVGVMVGGFWILGMLLVMLIKPFRSQARPFARSRSLLIFLALSFYVIWFAGGEYSVVIVFLMGFAAMLVWLLNGKNQVLSAELETYQAKHYETAFIVTSLIFVVTLNLVISMNKKTNRDNKTIYLSNIIMFSLAMAVLVSIGAVDALHKWKAPVLTRPRSYSKIETTVSSPGVGEASELSTDLFTKST
jgi:hypothetical protein